MYFPFPQTLKQKQYAVDVLPFYFGDALAHSSMWVLNSLAMLKTMPLIRVRTTAMPTRSQTSFLQILIKMLVLKLKSGLEICALTWKVVAMAPMGPHRWNKVDINLKMRTQTMINYLPKVQQFMEQVPWFEPKNMHSSCYLIPTKDYQHIHGTTLAWAILDVNQE